MMNEPSTILDFKTIAGRKVHEAECLPGFFVFDKKIEEGRQRLRFMHECEINQPDLNVHFIRFEDNVYQVNFLSRQSHIGKPVNIYYADAIEQAVLRKTAPEIEGKLIILPNPSPKQFAYHHGVKKFCEECETSHEQIIYAIFERADELGTGIPRRENGSLLYFFKQWKESLE